MNKIEPIVIIESNRIYNFDKAKTIHKIKYANESLEIIEKEIDLSKAKKIFIPHFCAINNGIVELYPESNLRKIAKMIFNKLLY
jgi:hypothetical protein